MAWEACSHLHRILMLFSILVFNNQHKSCINLNMPNQLSLHSIWTDDCWFKLCRPYCFHHSRAKFRRNEQVCFCCHTNQRPEKLLNKTFCHVFVYQFHNFILFCFISTRINVTQPNQILSLKLRSLIIFSAAKNLLKSTFIPFQSLHLLHICRSTKKKNSRFVWSYRIIYIQYRELPMKENDSQYSFLGKMNFLLFKLNCENVPLWKAF